jgi:hypothetical protein
MAFHLLNYNNPVAGINDANVDMTASTDGEFSIRNGHFILTESYRLIKACAIGASMLRAVLFAPSWNNLGELSVMSVNRLLTPPANTQYDDYRQMPLKLPTVEELQVKDSNNLGSSTEIENVGLVLIPDDWTPQLPAGAPMFCVKTTFTVTPTLNAWSGGQAIAFSQSLLGGVYAVVGAMLQGGNATFFRIIFPRNKLYGARKLRPGGIVQNAVGNVPYSQQQPWMMDMGVWGYFHTFELPTCEVFGTLASSTAYVLYLWLVRIGKAESLLSGLLGAQISPAMS